MHVKRINKFLCSALKLDGQYQYLCVRVGE